MIRKWDCGVRIDELSIGGLWSRTMTEIDLESPIRNRYSPNLYLPRLDPTVDPLNRPPLAPRAPRLVRGRAHSLLAGNQQAQLRPDTSCSVVMSLLHDRLSDSVMALSSNPQSLFPQSAIAIPPIRNRYSANRQSLFPQSESPNHSITPSLNNHSIPRSSVAQLTPLRPQKWPLAPGTHFAVTTH
jgi:hypothetical protein